MVVIIGAGPAGLATAYYLQRYGIAFKILEQHGIGSSWARFYDHVRLHSLKEHSALPGLPMPKEYPSFPSGQQVYDYLQTYAKYFRFDIQTQTKVLKAEYDNSWKLETTEGLVNAEKLIVATGIFNTPFVPRIEGLGSFTGQILHSQQYKRPEDFLNKKVLVVGVGNSGAEIAVALAKAGVQTDIVLRDGVLLVPFPRSFVLSSFNYWLLRTMPRGFSNFLLHYTQQNFSSFGLPLQKKEPVKRYPVVGFELAQLVKENRIRVRPALHHVHSEGVKFVNGQQAHYDTLILATGFRPTLDFIAPKLQEHPALYTLGFHYPSTEPFLLAVKREAKQLALKLVKS
jgi:cation diffusion facilitator CzcD-associated flavoprotein CzcO